MTISLPQAHTSSPPKNKNHPAQGRIAADNIAGRPSTFRGTQGTSVVGLFGLTVASTGASEKTLKRLGRPYAKVLTHGGWLCSMLACVAGVWVCVGS